MKVPHLQHRHIYTALNGSVLDSRMHVHVYRCSAMPDSLRCHGLQPARLLCPWDFPGKSTGVGCHFLLQCMKVKSESEVAQSCPTLRDPMDCSPPGSSARGIFQARVLEWGAIAFSDRHIYTALNGSVLDFRMHVRVYRHSVMPDSLRPHGLPVACQGPLSMGFSRREYWRWLPFLLHLFL